MKLLTYTLGGLSRLGAFLGEWVVDLNYAYAFYLESAKGEKAAKKLADE